MNSTLRLIAVAGCVLGAGCASTPPVTLQYFAPRAEVRVDAAVTVACSAANIPSSIGTVSGAVVSYSADFGQPRSINLGALDGQWANTEIGVTLTADGRLSGINSTQTGQGEKILEAILEFSGAAASADQTSEPELCQEIRRRGKDGVLMFKLQASPSLNTAGRTALSAASQIDEAIYAEISRLDGVMCLVTEPLPGSGRPALSVIPRSGDISLPLTQPRTVKLEVHTVDRAECNGSAELTSEPSWRGYVAVPQGGTDYTVPIPRAAIFGQQTFVLTLSEAGAIQTLKYGQQSGTAAAVAGLSDAVDQHNDETAAETAARLKAEADLISTQRRLVRCQSGLDPC